MAQITVASFNKLTPLWTFGGATCTLKLYYTKEFVDSDSNIVLEGSLDNPHQSITCNISSGVITIPSVTLTSTTDGTPTTSSLTGIFFDNTGIRRLTFFWKYAIPAVPTSTSWDVIFLYNQPSPVLPEEYYNKTQVDLLLAGMVDDITVSSVTLFNDYGNSLATAISEIGSTPTTLIVDQDTTVSTALVIPATLTLDFRAEATITRSGSGSLTFSGVGIANDPPFQIFSGFAYNQLAWTNVAPELRIEWFGGGVEIADNSAALTLMLKLLSVLTPTTNRTGGTIKFNAGIYRFNTQVNAAADAVRHVRLTGLGAKCTSFGYIPGTNLLFTGTGSGTAFTLNPQSICIEHLAFTFNAGFTGTLVDLGGVAAGTTDVRVSNCHFGGNWTTGVLPTDANMLIYLSQVYDAQIEGCSFIGGNIGIKINPTANTNDANMVTIAGCSFYLLRRAGIMNFYQNQVVRSCTFGGIGFGFGASVYSGTGGVPYAIDYDFDSLVFNYGTEVSGNWFGDRVANGRGCIRLPRTFGFDIHSNFFSGGQNSATELLATGTGSIGDVTLTAASSVFATHMVGARVWVPSISYTGLIASYTSATEVKMDTVFPNNFAVADMILATTDVREYTSNISGLSATDGLTISGVVIPTDVLGKTIWIPSINFVSRVLTRTSDTTITIADALPSDITNVSGQVGYYSYNGCAIEVFNSSVGSVTGNYFGGGMHAINTGDTIFEELNDLSVTNASNTVTSTQPFLNEFDLTSQVFEAVSSGWSVPPGTSVTAVATDVNGTTFTLSNNVTVTAGSNPRRGLIRNVGAGSTQVFAGGNSFACIDTLSNPFTNGRAEALYNTATTGKYALVGNAMQHPTGFNWDYNSRNQGFFNDDFGGGDQVISIGNRSTVPTANPASGFLFYGEAGVPTFRESGGSIYNPQPRGGATAAEIDQLNDVSAYQETIAAAGALSVVKVYSKLALSGAGAVTLAAPDATMLGQQKVIEMTVDNGDVTLSLANCEGGTAATTCTWNDVGDKLILIAGVSKWTIVKEMGVVLT